MGNRVHSGPVPSRQGGLHSTIVRCRESDVALDADLVPGVCGDALFAPAAHAGYVQLRQSGHQVSFPGGG